MTTKLLEKKEEIRVKAKTLHDVFEEAGPDRDFTRVKALEGDVAAKLDQVRQLNTELGALNLEIKGLEEIEGIFQNAQALWRADNEPVNPVQHINPDMGGRRVFKSLGRLLVESPQYQSQKNRRQWAEPAEFPGIDVRNTVFQTGGGWDPQDIRISRVELSPQRPIAVVDHIPMLPTSESSIVYMEETTFTNNATETAESTATTASDLIGEAALALTERTKPVEWLPVFLPVTMQQMEDQEGIEAYVDSRLANMIRQRVDLQVLAGNGTTPNLEGTENVTGIQAQALGTDSIPDAIYKAMTSVRDDGFAEPSVVFIRAAKWQSVRLLKTADGQYIWGHPSMSGPETIWGVPVVQSNAVTSTKAILGDYANYSAIYTKRGITFAVSDSHSSYFTRGMLAVRADMRLAMVHFRPKAFAEVTGL